ncbi:M36 family metallopeptidase [Arundinibacter roseus]|uniref:DUF11 domain-containing protein n=1 Tax=Arundinibacter roseus TaxID=2070510 RepID=A0A4R4KQR3_9BACT|nr:M36 family metallopeptidase [Arundinibacter roseus]TDB68969.1 hypothetical protein EZE20_01115 [Arundinibacter roseus]
MIKTLVLILSLSIIFIAGQAQDYKKEALALLRKNQADTQLRSLKNIQITDAFPNQTSGTFIVYVQQVKEDIPVANAIRTLVFKDQKLISQSGDFVQRFASKGVKKAHQIPAESAVNQAIKHLGLSKALRASPVGSDTLANGQQITFAANAISQKPIPAQLLWVKDSSGVAVLSWEVGISPLSSDDHWLVRVEVSSGRIVNKVNLTVYCQWVTPHSHLPDVGHQADGSHSFHSPNPVVLQPSAAVDSVIYRVIPFPNESPSHLNGAFAEVVNPWQLAGAGHPAVTLNWHNDGTTEYSYTRGNNVYAYEDRDANNLPGLAATSSTSLPNLTFTSVFDENTAPTAATNQQAAITNLFYWNNIIHDVMYRYGFDELRGNFQNNNLGRGGAGGDYVLADAQDGSGANNANFSTPPDGSRPRMQMYLFDPPSGSSIQRDGDFDNGIIVHEYGHGISTRLTGGPSQVTCLSNAEQMGEGWSDYYALMFTTNWANALLSQGADLRPIGTYALAQPATGSGIRTYPYTTNMNVNPMTYAYVANSSSVHYIGSVWCTMIWDMTWEIIQQTGQISPNLYEAESPGGNTIAMRLVTEALKIQPCSPGFVDARNAILLADTLLFNGAYSCAIWRAFARRGLGAGASQGNSDSYTDQVAAFDTPFAQITKTANVSSARENGEFSYTLTVTCSCEAFSNYVIRDTIPSTLTYLSGGVYDSLTREVTFGPVSLNPGQQAFYFLEVKNNMPYDKVIHLTSDGSTLAPFTTSTLSGINAWGVSTNRFRSTGSSLRVLNTGLVSTVALTSPAYTLGTGISMLSFWHFIDLEDGYDGGVVEISTDNGNNWMDLQPYIIQNGYNYMLSSDYANYLGGRPAFSGYVPFFVNTLIDLSSFINQTIRIRFLFGEDESFGYEGWYLDDIELKSETSLINNAYLMNGAAVAGIGRNILPILPPQNILSVSSGTWTDPTIWSCGCVPQFTDSVTINPGHTIQINRINARVKEIMYNEGTVEMINSGSLQLN